MGSSAAGDSPEALERDAELIFQYHQLGHEPQASDVIFCLCSLDLRVAERAAQLWLDGLAPWLVFSGASGKLTRGLFGGLPEAEAFAAVARRMGVPGERIVVEPRATNTGENVRFTHALLRERGIRADSLVLVQKPYMERRTWATFRRQWPGADAADSDSSDADAVRICVTSPRFAAFADYPDAENPRALVVNVMVGDLVRIRDYPARGFQVEQDIPPEVWAAMGRLVRAGYDEHLPEGFTLEEQTA
ncbi:cyclopropane-fatty-acyl-phospholipid synthase [Purpureocillium lavendulum]|uniref:Cyclopropane-fatty-acyl-phospholipid synthase n=1 Tax=Purpureocillium lavendulum TaxID=1247861 RepID=A0AB34FUZ2_9HYPO|nr:cyclopropane-fatty-acyl-phospholipid synthase [Purpureocillium lavendulum]